MGLPIVMLGRSRILESTCRHRRPPGASFSSHLLSLGHRAVAFIDAAAAGKQREDEGYEGWRSGPKASRHPRLVVNPHGHALTDGYERCRISDARPLPGSRFASKHSLAIGALAGAAQRARPGDLALVRYEISSEDFIKCR